MLTVALLGLAATCLLALRNWRWGIYAFFVTAFAQDPLRKLTDGQPPIYILFAGIVFAAAAAGAWLSDGLSTQTSNPEWRRLRTPGVLFLSIIALEALNGFARIGSPLPPLLSLAFYVAPFVGVGVAAHFVSGLGEARLMRLLTLYVWLGALGAATIGLQAMGVELSTFGEVGSGIQIFGADSLVAANSGLFRAAEVAGWHAATAAALGVVLLTRRGFDARRVVIALIFAAALSWLAILTGRRKALLMILVFGGLYLVLTMIYVRRAAGFGLILGAAAGVGLLGAAAIFGPDEADSGYHAHLSRAGTVFTDISDRFLQTGLAPLEAVYDVYGPLGGGLGLATQGAQYAGLATGADPTWGAGEGGLGKLAIELGVPGLAATLVLGLSIARTIGRILAEVGARRPSAGRLLCGLAALLVANVANFSVASQTYGDVFIVLFLALILGAILAAPHWALTGTPYSLGARHPRESGDDNKRSRLIGRGSGSFNPGYGGQRSPHVRA